MSDTDAKDSLFDQLMEQEKKEKKKKPKRRKRSAGKIITSPSPPSKEVPPPLPSSAPNEDKGAGKSGSRSREEVRDFLDKFLGPRK